MATDALAPRVARTPAAKAFTTRDKWLPFVNTDGLSSIYAICHAVSKIVSMASRKTEVTPVR